MSVLTINDLISKISEYSKDETNIIKKLYEYVEFMYKNKKWQNSKNYIIYPIIYRQRYDTIYVNLLHDT